MAKIYGQGKPTSKTAGGVGDVYVDKLTGREYTCRFAYKDEPNEIATYDWKEVTQYHKRTETGGGSDYVTGYEPNDDDIPKVFIEGVIPTTKDDVLAEMTYKSKTDEFHAYLKIKCQGNTSMIFPKKNFTIKMYSDFERETKLKKTFKDWNSEQNKYVLKANWIDHSHARNIVSARLWSEVVKSRYDYDSLPTELKTSPNNGAIDGFPVKVYTNGTYQGIYTWNIGKDDWMWGMDEDNPNHVLMCAETNTDGVYAETPCNFRALWNGVNEEDWSVEVGTNSGAVKNGLNALISCVKDTDDETFKATIGNHLDIQSAIDYYIHQYVICGTDGLGKNMLLGTYNLNSEIETNQLLKYPYYHKLPFFESDGVTFTDNGDNSITVQGTSTSATGQSNYSLYPNKEGSSLLLTKGTYTLSINASDNYTMSGKVINANGEAVHWINLSSSLPSKTFTIDEDGYLSMMIGVSAGVTIDETIYPMLNVGDALLPFESYIDVSPKWYMGAYDMDATFGNYIMGGIGGVTATTRCPKDYQEQFSLLFERIYSLYTTELVERYKFLRTNVYSLPNMVTRFERFADIIGTELYNEDLTVYADIPAGDTNNIQQIRNFIRDRLDYVDKKIVVENDDYLYVLPEPTVFNGTDTFIDTGVKLFDEPKDFTIIVNFEADSEQVGDENYLTSNGEYNILAIRNSGSKYWRVITRGCSNAPEDEVNGSWVHSWVNTKTIVLVVKNGVFTLGGYKLNSQPNVKYIQIHENNDYYQENGTLKIGCFKGTWGSEPENFWKGTVNDFRVYNRALSEEEVSALILSY